MSDPAVTTHPPGATDRPSRVLVVDGVGPIVTVQDLGRIGLARLGVSRAGAADRASSARANRLVGNTARAAALEVLLGGLMVRSGAEHLVVALTGADCPLTLDGRPAAAGAVLDLPPGSRLTLGTASAGLRAYLAVRGGIVVPPVLGSRSRDTLAGLGPPGIRAGDELPVGPSAPYSSADVGSWPLLDQLPLPALPAADGEVVLRAVPGPRLAELPAESADRLWDQVWSVSPDSDRVGVRLTGARPLRTRSAGGWPSDPLLRGAVQVPPGGEPVVFLADHPVTGGYPVVAVVLDADTDLLAQARPGARVRLRRVTLGGPSRHPDLRCPWWGW
ncbi:MAG TPA: biotin-dependent carboxyltransferase family protein [Kineosporiaceae bacterium]